MITLWCKDSRSITSYPEHIDAVFTSPPYNVGCDYGFDAHDEKIPDKRSGNDYLDMLMMTFDCCRDRGAKSLWVNMKAGNLNLLNKLNVAAIETKWNYQHTFCWVYSATNPSGESFGHFQPTRGNNPHWGFELIYLFSRDENQVKLNRKAVGVAYKHKANLTRFTKENGGEPKQDLRCRGNVWCLPYETKFQTGHPCPFPVGLPEMALRLLDLPPGAMVVDPFCGSGTTGVAAQKLGHHFHGLDLSPKFLSIAATRLGVNHD